MSRGSKRYLDVIDLTGDDDDDTRAPSKHARFNAGPSHRVSSQSSTASSSSASAAFSGSSQRIPSSSSSILSSDRYAASPASSFGAAAEPETIDLTQTDDGPARELYGTIDDKIVGIRYYNGVATAGEFVLCRREPSNPYDSNAIRVDNVYGNQVGHIPRNLAAKLAPYIDRDDIAIEAMLTGEKGAWDCPVRISLLGPVGPEARAQLEVRLKQDKLLKAGQLKQTRQENDARRAMRLKSGRSSAGFRANGVVEQPEVSLAQLVQASQAVQLRPSDDIVKTLALSEDELAKMPMAPQPAQLRSTLLPYQLQGLAWMTKKEAPQFPAPGSPETVQLWKRTANGNHVNLATNFTVKAPPTLMSGGILGDDMGLGKTIQVISLILAGGGKGPTLIVAPVSVMSNWEQQVRRHVLEEHTPRLLIYHGSARSVSAGDLSKYDIVVTSYGTLSSEMKGGPLFSITWRRIVLDEGHTIRNAKTKIAEAACLLQAQSRWVLTGTPIINNVRDLHSLLKFLCITGGVEQSEIFNAVIARPLAWGNPQAEALLQSLMRDLCLRRKKDMAFVDLKIPPKTEYVHRITFWSDEQRKYDALLAEAKGVLAEFQMKSKAGESGRFQNVLERLLRLRQTCCHWTLCKQRIADLLKVLEDQDIVALNDENRAILQGALQLFIESQEECAICIDSLDAPVITHCKHVFCRACVTKVIDIQHKCPMCRAELSEDKLLDPAPETSGEDEGAALDTEYKSSKTEALLKILQATMKNKESKVVIFSQWTSFLTVIQHQLEEAGHGFTRIDGSMTAAKRDAAIQALDEDPNTRILLASLSVCSVGLNLVSADTVILADSWWAPAIEDQAVDRVHRLGQTRPTTVWRLVMEGTVEERVLDVQAEKRELVTKAFQEKDGGKKKKTKETRMADILKLLG